MYILPVTHLKFKANQLEGSVDTAMTLGIKMLTFINEDDEPIMFSDCADVPFKITLSDTKNFAIEEYFSKRQCNN